MGFSTFLLQAADGGDAKEILPPHNGLEEAEEIPAAWSVAEDPRGLLDAGYKLGKVKVDLVGVDSTTIKSQKGVK